MFFSGNMQWQERGLKEGLSKLGKIGNVDTERDQLTPFRSSTQLLGNQNTVERLKKYPFLPDSFFWR